MIQLLGNLCAKMSRTIGYCVIDGKNTRFVCSALYAGDEYLISQSIGKVAAAQPELVTRDVSS
jgi:hypothetical protein